MTHEGGFWFTDLTIPDPYYGLPIIAAASTLALMNSSQMGDTLKQMGDNAAMFRNLGILFAFIMIPAGGYAPSGIALLWGSNALLSVLQNHVLGITGVRRAIGLPPLKAPDGSTEQGSMIEQLVGKWKQSRNPGAADAAKAAATSGALSAPPPGSRPAVNYLANKPRQRRR